MKADLEPLTADDLLHMFRAWAERGVAVVDRETLELQLRTDQRYEWGDPHGWRIREAEDAEFRSPLPRFWKWRREEAEQTLFAYTLAGVEAAGWERSAP